MHIYYYEHNIPPIKYDSFVCCDVHNIVCVLIWRVGSWENKFIFKAYCRGHFL